MRAYTPSRRQQLGGQYQSFANPFFDVAGTYLPKSVKSLFRYCRHYYLTHGIINTIVTKASEYPVTDVVIQHTSKGVVSLWEELLLGQMNYRVHQFEINIDYHTYGNCFVSPNFPFRKILQCNNCTARHPAVESRPNWRYTNHNFWLSCTKCGQSGNATAMDEYVAKPSGVGLIRWNPENVSIFCNESTGRLDYALELEGSFVSQIKMGRKDLVATTPQIFLDAAKNNRNLVFDKSSIFHMRRPGVSSMNKGWGVPLLMPVLKDVFYMQIMKRAQEAVLLTHILPQTFLFPQPASGAADPFVTADLSKWKTKINSELARQRMDPSYYGVLPFPLGHQTIGENGRSLLLMPEIQQISEQISTGMGFPPNILTGQGTFAGSSVSMRMLENFFLANVHSQSRLLHWAMRQFGAFLNWPVPDARFKPFKMADDLQRQAFMFQLNTAGKVSDTTLLSYMDLKIEDEDALMVAEASQRAEAMKRQQLLNAEIQADAGVVAAKGQARAEAAMMEAQQSHANQTQKDPFAQSMQSPAHGPPGVSLDAAATALAAKIRELPPERREVWMAQLQEQSPEMAHMVQGQMPDMASYGGMPAPPQNGGGSSGGAPAGGQDGVDMRAMPEQNPPRRNSLQ